MPNKPFLPKKLPPNIDYTTILPNIIKAREIIARYDESVKRLPNPEIIERSFETKEAVLSSRIEGTQATLNEVLIFDAKNIKSEDNEKEKDYKEIINYRRAVKVGKNLLKNKPLSENVIKELHRILLGSVRGQNKTPGKFRTTQVFIGPYGASIERATFVPPEPQRIPSLFSNLEKYLHSEDVIDPLAQIAIAHYQFEAIHPFLDGNGRVGRLLIPLFLYEQKITTYPNIYISEYLETHREIYYRLLQNVNEKEDWIPWITFFLDAICEQTETSLARVVKIEKLYKELKEKIPNINSIYAGLFLDAIFVKPVFSINSIKPISKIQNNQTLYTLVEKFVKAGIIRNINPKEERNKIYIFSELYRIIR